MAMRDRSNEFKSIVQHTTDSVEPRVLKASKPPNDFFVLAKNVHKKCSRATHHFERLDLLNLKSSNLDEGREKYNSILTVIGEDLNDVETEIKMLEKVLVWSAYKSKQQEQLCANVLLHLGDEHSLLRRKLKEYLREYCERLKQRRDHIKQFSGNTILDSMPSYESAQDPVLANQLQETIYFSRDLADHYSLSTNELQRIECTVLEIGQMLTNIAETVQHQGESIQRIDSHVESVSLNIEAAHSEIVKHFASMVGRQSLMLKVFAVLVVFFVVVVLVV